jgi:hypothetical protein
MPRPQGLSSFLAPESVGARAAVWAARARDEQRRAADRAPFLLHPLEVALLLHQAGCSEEVIAAGILHDVAENGTTTLDDVRAAFGPAIGDIVAALTGDPGTGGRDALVVFAADRLASARELRAAADAMSARAAARERARHEASLELLERRLAGHPLTEALRFELEAQEHVPVPAWVAPTPADEPRAM